MAELDAILAEMDRINRQMRVAVHKAGDDLTQQIVSLRQEFSAETGNLIQHLPGDMRLRYRPELFDEFQERLSDVRRRLTSHQAKWSIQDIAAHREDYIHAADQVHHSIADYLEWARGQLGKAPHRA